ncbi:Adhesion G-protein coupled receptor G4, partial [Araneus ventricosus]
QIFSKSWNKFAHQNSCYYVEKSGRTWKEASKSCQAFPVKSSLLQSIQYLEDYSLFKVLLHMLTPFLQGSSWWINLYQDKDSLKWLNFPEETVTFIDWEAHTNFKMNQSGGVLMLGSPGENSIRWSLRDLSSEEGFICEMQDCSDTRPTFVYIEDRTTSPTAEETGIISKLNLHCVPSGWFLSGSISWFKDGFLIEDPLYEISMNRLSLSLKTTKNLMDILRFQGYYRCSIDREYPFKQVFSPKVLFKIPGLHTFVLHMKSEASEVSNCSHSISLKLPYADALNKHLLEILPKGSVAILRDASCTDSKLHYYDHIYFSEELGGENEIKKVIENSFTFGNDVLLELLKQLQVDKKDISIRSTVKCPREKFYHNRRILNWPETPIGQSALPEEICVTVEGDALERKCLGDFDVGAYWSPVKKDCDVVHSDLTVNLQKLARTNITADNILNSSLNMEILTTTWKDLRSMDVQYVAQILRNMESVPDIKPQVLRAVVNTVDSVITAKISASDRRIALTNASCRISAAMENIATSVQTDGQVIKEAGNNIAVCIMPYSSNVTLIPTGGVLENWGSNVTTLFNDSDRDPYSHFETFEAAVLLPDNLLAQKQNSSVSNIPIIIRRNINFLKNIDVISPVIDVSVGNEPVYDVDPPIELIFKVPEIPVKQKEEFFQCVFWDQSLNDNYGGWSFKGCYNSYVDSTHMRCFCNHLTSFAVILELKPGSEILKVHQTSLSIITYIGCSLSIFGLGAIIVTFIAFRKWRKDVKHKVLFNLSLALISFLLIFLIGIEKTESRYGCMAVAVLLHYFMLSSFTWMLVEAFMQYLSLVKVIGTYIPRLIQKAMLFAWGVPFTIVGIVLCINYDLYSSRHKYCWLSDNIFYLAVAAPVLSMLALNFVIFALILYSNTCGRSTKYLRTNQNERQETIARAKAVFCVSILLGLSWIFGFLAVDEAKLIFQYLFAITTTSQGFLIFVFFVFRQKSTRDLWLNLVRTAPSPEISHITGGTEVTSRGLNHRSVQSRLSRVTYKAKLSYISFNG